MLTRSNTALRAPTPTLVIGGRIVSIVCAFYMPISAVQAQTGWVADYEYGVSEVMTLSMNAPEVQSTVVKPGLKAECPAGRFLASNNSGLKLAERKNIANGVVQGRDLDNPTGPVIFATFDTPLDINDRMHGNDHDLLVLNNGDVLLTVLIGSKIDIKPEERPDWWDAAHNMTWIDRDNKDLGLKLLEPDFGPGARSDVMIYRSTDCGQSFQYLSDFESWKHLDGSCAYPNGGSTENTTGSGPKKIWYRGGTDGVLTKVDQITGRIYMTYQCIAQYPISEDPWMVKECAKHKAWCLETPVNKTLIAASEDGGEKWDVLGALPFREWRQDIVPLSPDLVMLEHGNTIGFAAQLDTGGWLVTELFQKLPDYYGKNAAKNAPKDLGIGRGNFPTAIMSRVPGSSTKVLVALPDKIDINNLNQHGFGYRLFLFDMETVSYVELAPVLPQSNSLNDVVTHLVAIDIGKGPVLLYWSDFNTTLNTATIRGRFILSDTQYTSDFQVARDIPSSSPSMYFNSNWKHTWGINSPKWYGHYHTAWGYRAASVTQIMSAEGQTGDTIKPPAASTPQIMSPEGQTGEILKRQDPSTPQITSPGDQTFVNNMPPLAEYHYYPVWPESDTPNTPDTPDTPGTKKVKVQYAHVSVRAGWTPLIQLSEEQISIMRIMTNKRDAQDKSAQRSAAPDRRAQGTDTREGAPPKVQIRTVDPAKGWVATRSIDINRLPPDAPELQPFVDYEEYKRSGEEAEIQQRRN